MKPLLQKVDCIRLPVPDLDAALAFYRDRLGHELIWRTETSAALRLPQSDCELVLFSEGVDPEVDWKVESAEGAVEDFVRAGGAVVEPPFDIPVGRCAVVRDPLGNNLVLLDLSKGTFRTAADGTIVGMNPPARRESAEPAAEPDEDRGEVTLVEEAPAPGEYLALRRLVGWGLPGESAIGPSLRNSLYCVCARSRGRIVGMARVIGDGGMVFYIQDVIVDPARRGEGLGARLMDKVMEFIRARAVPHTIVGLMAARGKEAFYERYGFTRRPNEKFGAGMTIFWEAT